MSVQERQTEVSLAQVELTSENISEQAGPCEEEKR